MLAQSKHTTDLDPDEHENDSRSVAVKPQEAVPVLELEPVEEWLDGVLVEEICGDRAVVVLGARFDLFDSTGIDEIFVVTNPEVRELRSETLRVRFESFDGSLHESQLLRIVQVSGLEQSLLDL